MVVETEATGDIKVTPLADTEAQATGIMEVTLLVDTKVSAHTSTKPSVHMGEGFLGPSEYFVLTRYVDQVTWRLWQKEVYIIIMLNLFIVTIDTLNRIDFFYFVLYLTGCH